MALPLPPELVHMVVVEKRRMDLARGASRLAAFERNVWRLTAAMRNASSDFESAFEYLRYVSHWHHEAAQEHGRACRRARRLMAQKKRLAMRGRKYGCIPNCLSGLDAVYNTDLRGTIACLADAARHRAGKRSLMRD